MDFDRTIDIAVFFLLSLAYFLVGFVVVGLGHVFGIDGLGRMDNPTPRDFGIMVLWPLFLIKWVAMGLWSGLSPAFALLFS